MPIKTIFTSTDELLDYELELFRNTDNKLYIGIYANGDFYDGGFITLSIEDAKHLQVILKGTIEDMESEVNNG